jgi:hypothetical protein
LYLVTGVKARGGMSAWTHIISDWKLRKFVLMEMFPSGNVRCGAGKQEAGRDGRLVDVRKWPSAAGGSANHRFSDR